MSESALSRCLTDMTPAEWYRGLNSKVFFWPTEERLRRLLSARAYRQTSQTVIVVDTAALLNCCGDQVRLSPLNSGSTAYNPLPRGRSTFQRLEDYPFEFRRKRGLQPVAEVAVEGGIPQITDLILRVATWEGGQEREAVLIKA